MQEWWIQLRLGWKSHKLWKRTLSKAERHEYHRILLLAYELIALGFIIGFVIGVVFPW